MNQNILKRIFSNPDKSVFIYTEDKPEDVVFYQLLLKRIKSKKFIIRKIQPIGSKSQVIEKSLEDESPMVPSLYLVDGDIKLLLGKRISKKNLISLDRYCIENFLCCEKGIVSFLEVKLGLDKKVIKIKLDLENYVKNHCSLILKLYYRYALSFDLGCGVKFEKFDSFVSRSTPKLILDSDLIKTEIARVEVQIKNKLKASGTKSYNVEMKKRLTVIQKRYPLSYHSIIRVLSGKDHLLPLVEYRINELDSTSKSLDRDQLKRTLAKEIDLGPFDRIIKKIEKLV